jgi:dTDP-4-amino-4,6-dideoxygalactose transaminase
MIPFLDLKSVTNPFAEEILECASNIIKSGWYILGENVNSFEMEFSDYCGVEETIGTANGYVTKDAVVLDLNIKDKNGQQYKLLNNEPMMI